MSLQEVVWFREPEPSSRSVLASALNGRWKTMPKARIVPSKIYHDASLGLRKVLRMVCEGERYVRINARFAMSIETKAIARASSPSPRKRELTNTTTTINSVIEPCSRGIATVFLLNSLSLVLRDDFLITSTSYSASKMSY